MLNALDSDSNAHVVGGPDALVRDEDRNRERVCTTEAVEDHDWLRPASLASVEGPKLKESDQREPASHTRERDGCLVGRRQRLEDHPPRLDGVAADTWRSFWVLIDQRSTPHARAAENRVCRSGAGAAISAAAAGHQHQQDRRRSAAHRFSQAMPSLSRSRPLFSR